MEKDNFMNTIEYFMTGAQDKMVIHQDTSDGFMDLTVYYILPGIFLALNDIHTQMIPLYQSHSSQNMLVINYCMEGRCEFQIKEDSYSYLDHYMMNLSSKMVMNRFFYPSCFYKGCELYILPDTFTDKTRDFLDLFHINIAELIHLYKDGAIFYVSDTILKLWNNISDNLLKDNIGQLRLSTLQLLKYLSDHKLTTTPTLPYLSKVQVTLAQKAQELMTKDLSHHFSMKSIAETLGVSETSLKRYFHSVYGANVSSYMNETRMKYAAELLATSKLNVSDVAKACGYVNQGRFASVFYQFHGMKPLDYRRKKNLNTLTSF